MNPHLSSILSRCLIDRRNGHRLAVLSKYRDLLHISSLPTDEIFGYQNQRLADLLNHAAAHVPFWKKHIKEPVTSANAREVLTSLPVMERTAIQTSQELFVDERIKTGILSVIQSPLTNNESLITNNQSPLGITEDATGGSTGTPMRFLVDRSTQIAREASLYWANHLAGWRYGNRVAMLWGSDRDLGNAKKSPRLELRWKIDNIRWYNAFDMGEDQMAAFHEDMRRFQPHIIVAYAGSLELYARFLQTRNQEPRTINYPLKALISSAEVLATAMRRTIEDVFNKPVFNRYGNRECGAIAAEDGKGGLLINQDDFIVEIDSPDPVREPGPLLITYCANRVMPFIRYNTGDLGVWIHSEEGRRVKRIVGRQGDTIRTREGKLIHGEYFTHLMYGAKGVCEFQFVQETLDRYRLLVVGEELVAHEVEHWRAGLAKVLGAAADVKISRVDAIPVLPSGKRNFTVSYLRQE